MPFSDPTSRRAFLRTLSLGTGATLVGASALAHPLHWLADGPTADRKLGVALVGLGKYSTGQLAPALQQTQHCRLAGIVTGSPAKAAQWKQQYNLPDKSIYDYKTFDRMIDNPDIDIVYVVLPNACTPSTWCGPPRRASTSPAKSRWPPRRPMPAA